VVEEFIGTTRPIAVCEPACGSGGTSLKLAERFEISEVVLLDISPSAVAFANSLIPAKLVDRSEVIQVDAFATELADNRFDLVWNVGVIEHYLPDQILEMIQEMFRITKPGGTVLVAYPNRRSIAVLKAALLRSWFGRHFLHWLSGYRFDTEILYSDSFLAELICEHMGSAVVTRYAGSALWAGAPTALVKLEQKLFPRSRFSFLTFLAIRKPIIKSACKQSD
jgi:ubiquinone/menaquinone biosynthesis C-methylase UbiE